MRKRYDRFLGSTYNPDIFHLQTTATDRTKMSGMLETAALWKPNEDQMFRPDLPWQPIALFYQEFTEDTLMLVWNKCPKYTRLRTSVNDQPEVRQVHEHNQQLFAELTNLTGMPITNVGDVSSLYSTLTAEKEMNLTLPEWTKDYYPDKLLNLTLYDLKLNTYDNSFRRLKGGPLLKKIVDDMIEKKNQITHRNLRKLIMYMGHDSTIATLLDTMHIWHHQVPHYNIMIMIELHYYENEWNVQIFLRNATTSEPHPMIIPECSAACPLNKFVEILKPVIPDDWKEECKVEGDYVMPSPPLP